MNTNERLEYNIADLRGIAKKLRDYDDRATALDMARHVEDVAFSLETLVLDEDNDQEDAIIAELEENLWNSPAGASE